MIRRLKYGLWLGIMLMVFSQLSAENISLTSTSLQGLGYATAFCDYEDYGLFVGGYHHLAVIDYAEPSGMPVAFLDIPDNYAKSYAVLCHGNHAYLFVGESMFIISLEDILHPRMVKEIQLSSRRRACLIQDNVLYIATYAGYLTSYNLNNPEHLVNLDSITIPSLDYENMVAGEGFIACQGDSIYIVDTSNPSDLRLAASISHSDSAPDYTNSQAAALGPYLVCSSLNELTVYNLTDPDMPTQTGSLVLPCADLLYRTHVHDSVLWSLYLDGSWEESQIGIMAIDLSNPSSPIVSNKQQLIEYMEPYTCSMFMRISGNRLAFFYPSYLPQGIKTAVLSGSSSAISGITIRYGSMGEVIANDKWIVGLNGAINILEFDGSQNLHSTRQFRLESSYGRVLQIKDDLLLSAYSHINTENDYSYAPTLDIYDLPSGTKLSSYSLPTVQGGEFPTLPQSIAIYDHYALLCNGLGGMVCLDISDPVHPLQVFWLWDPFYEMLSVAVRGTNLWLGAYVNMAGGYLSCYDISDFDNPIHDTDTWLGDFFPASMMIKGDYLYLHSSGYIKRCHLGSEGVTDQNDLYLSGSGFSCMQPFGQGFLFGGDRRMEVQALKDPLQLLRTGLQELEMVSPDYPGDPSYYPQANYAVQGHKILVANGHYVKCFDATLAAVMCEAELDFETTALQIFPNPSREQAFIGFQAADNGAATLELYNLRGQKVLVRSLSSVKQGFNLQNLPLKDDNGHQLGTGVYILKVRTPGKTQVAKLAVTH